VDFSVAVGLCVGWRVYMNRWMEIQWVMVFQLFCVKIIYVYQSRMEFLYVNYDFDKPDMHLDDESM
jgi:hypothetical protein